MPHCKALIPALQPSWCLAATQSHPAGTEASPPAVQLFHMLPAEDAADAQATDASRKKRKVSVVRSAVISRPSFASCSASLLRWLAASARRRPVADPWPAMCLQFVSLPEALSLPSWESRSRFQEHVCIWCEWPCLYSHEEACK